MLFQKYSGCDLLDLKSKVTILLIHVCSILSTLNLTNGTLWYRRISFRFKIKDCGLNFSYTCTCILNFPCIVFDKIGKDEHFLY